jgi:hypothetical protein
MRLPRWSVAVLVLALSLWLLACLPGPAAAAPPPANSAAASPRLKYLPKDYWAVAEVDWSTVMSAVTNENAQKNPQYAQLKQYLQLAKRFTGIALEEDVDAVTLFATGTPGEKAKWLVVAQGSFKNDFVAKRLKASLGDSLTEKTHKKRTIYSLSEADFCFPEPSTILLGDEALVREAIDQLADKPQPLPEALKSVLEQTPNKSVVWAAVRPPVLLEHEALADWREGNRDLYRALKKIECLSLFFDLSDDGLLIKGLGHVSGPGEAKSVYKYLSDRKKKLLHEEGSNIVYTSLLILSEVKTSGPHVEGSFRLTGQAFKELWDAKVIIRPDSTPGPADKKENEKP